MDTTSRLAEFSVRISFSDMPPEVIKKGKERLLDTIGCILGGSHDEVAKIILQYVESIGRTSESRIIANGHRTSPQNAACVNGTIGHALDYDDSQLSMIGHPSVVILPAALAVGEKMQTSGARLLEAFLVGFEVACKIGRGVNPTLYNNGWHATSAVGVFGATAAVGKIMGLNVDEMMSAFGIAASQSCGLRENFGTMTKPFHAGKASESGVIAALLSKQGFTAARNILEAKRGFCNTLAGEYNLNNMIEHLGDPYEIISPGVHTKPYPSCLATHAIIDATIALAEEHAIAAEDVESVECGVGHLATEVLIHDNPKTSLEGKFSAQFVTAISLLERQASLNQFTDEKVQDPRTVNLMKRIKMVPHADLAEVPMPPPAIVSIKLKDGRHVSKRVDIAKGNPEHALSEDEIATKYRECAEPIIGVDRVDRSIQIVGDLEKVGNINELMDVVAVEKSK